MENKKYRKLKIKIGEGSFKTVFKAIDEEEGKEVANNEVKIKNYEEETHSASSSSKEIALLRNIDHPYVIKIFDYWFTDENFVSITELMTGGTIRDYIDRVGPLNVRLIRKWGKQILEGLVYLHGSEPPIVHRDIKNENIFVSSQGDIKIGDLGVAKKKKHKRYTIIGTPNFMAREMFEGEGYTEKGDVYAFGMCLAEMSTGLIPYNELKENSEVYKFILQGILPKTMHCIQNNCLKSLIMGCIVSQNHRYSAAMCLDHHFFHPHVECKGDCIPKVCSAIYPLASSCKDMELSIISFSEDIITFQILLNETGRFIKFDYDISKDTPHRILEELCNENILQKDSSESFMDLFGSRVNVALSKKKSGMIIDGIIDIDSGEFGNIDESLCLNNIKNVPIVEEESEDSGRVDFGQKTIEVMKEIDEEMKALEKKKQIERQREEEIAMRLKAKLEGRISTSFSEDVKRLSLENIYDQFPNPDKNINEDSSPSQKCQQIIKNENNEDSLNSKSGDNIYRANDCKNGIDNNRVNENINNINRANDFKASNENLNNTGNNFNNRQNDLDENKQVYNSSQFNVTQKSLNQTNYDSDRASSIKNGNTLSSSDSLQPSPNKDHYISSPPISSPPFYSTKLMEEQVVNDQSLNESYDISKAKYKSNFSVTQFALDAAAITGKTEDTAKSWIKALKDEDLETVFDLKLILYEDWEKLPLTVFSSRAMQNMLYGIGNIPLKEKQLPMNPKLKDYDNKLSIKEFLEDICSLINRPELASSWENKLMAQDLRTVSELKSLHQDDWSRLGLSVFGYRILKNVIFRKGKITFE